MIQLVLGADAPHRVVRGVEKGVRWQTMRLCIESNESLREAIEYGGTSEIVVLNLDKLKSTVQDCMQYFLFEHAIHTFHIFTAILI